MAYWTVEYRHPKKGWIEVKKCIKKSEAEAFIEGSEEGLVESVDIMDRVFEKFRLKKSKGNLKEKENG